MAGKSGLGARFEAIYKKIADGGGNNTGNDKYTGDAHKDTSKPKGDGLDSHHCPAKNCYKNAPISSADGPAIKMDPADHKYTSSYGSGRAAKEYRARQKELVDQGRLKEAIQMDIDDIKNNPNIPNGKYNEALKQMQVYADSLNSDDFINR